MFWEEQKWKEEVRLAGEKRRIGTKNLTQTIMWLFNHDWELLVSKNLYMMFNKGYDTWTLKLDTPVHACHYVRSRSLLEPWKFLDCEEGSVWDLLERLTKDMAMYNSCYLYFMKDNKFVIINCGNNTIRFANNSLIKLYEGDQLKVDIDGILVTSKPEDAKQCSMVVKPNAKYLSQEKMQKVPLSEIWVKEMRRFGE